MHQTEGWTGLCKLISKPTFYSLRRHNTLLTGKNKTGKTSARLMVTPRHLICYVYLRKFRQKNEDAELWIGLSFYWMNSNRLCAIFWLPCPQKLWKYECIYYLQRANTRKGEVLKLWQVLNLWYLKRPLVVGQNLKMLFVGKLFKGTWLSLRNCCFKVYNSLLF